MSTENYQEVNPTVEHREDQTAKLAAAKMHDDTKHGASSDFRPASVRPANETIDYLFGTPQFVETKSRNEGDQPQTPEEKAGSPKEKIAQKFGVQIVQNDGKYQYILQANGERKVLLSTEASDGGLKEAGDKLAKMVERRTKEIENKWGVKITRPGETVWRGHVHNHDTQSSKDDVPLKSRTPKLAELEALEAALRRSRTSSMTGDARKPLTISFADGQSERHEGEKAPKGKEADAAHASYDAAHRRIVVFTRSTDEPATEKDATKPGVKKPGNEDYATSLEEVLVHELSHNTQRTNDAIADKGRPDDRLMQKLGWQHTEMGYAMKHKDGYLYVQGGDKDGPYWVRVDKDGNFITQDGTRTEDAEKAHRINHADMRRDAVVPPVTNYFNNPVEMMADAMAQYRLGDERRASLRKESPQLYDLVKKFDQLEIDKFYGRRSDGASRMIRLPDGNVVPNTAENRRQVLAFEQR